MNNTNTTEAQRNEIERQNEINERFAEIAENAPDGFAEEDAWKAAEIRLRYAADPLRRAQELEDNAARGLTLTELAAFLGTTVAQLREDFETNGTLF